MRDLELKYCPRRQDNPRFSLEDDFYLVFRSGTPTLQVFTVNPNRYIPLTRRDARNLFNWLKIYFAEADRK